MFKELVSFIFNEVPEDYHFCKLLPYTLAGEAACWFKKLPPGSLKTWKDIMNAFLNNFQYDVAANLEMESMMRYHINDPTMAKRDEYHGYGELNRVHKAGTGDSTSASIDTTSSTSIDSTTSASIESTTSTSIDITTSTSIDTDFCFRSTALEILEVLSCPQDVTDSTRESANISSSYLALDVDRAITMEDFSEI